MSIEYSRLSYLDALKCLGIIIVIFGHVRLFGFGQGTYDSLTSIVLYSFNMPLFFFISGFLAGKKRIGNNGEYRETVYRKFLGLVVPACVFFVIHSILNHTSILPINGFEKYWFTITLFEIFLIFYTILLFLKNQYWMITVLCLLSLLGVLYLVFPIKGIPDIIDMNHLAKYFQFFTIGVMAKMYPSIYDKAMKSDVIKTMAFLCFASCMFVLSSENISGLVYQITRDIILRYVCSYIIISWFYCNQTIFESRTIINRTILQIGQLSLPIYLLQYFFLPNYNLLPVWLHNLDPFNIYLLSIVYSFIILIVCLVAIQIISHSNWIKRNILCIK